MFKYLVRLKGTNKDFAIEELKSLWKTYFQEDINIVQLQNTFYSFSSENLLERDSKIEDRITLTNYLGLLRLKFIEYSELEDFFEKEDLSKLEGEYYKFDGHRAISDIEVKYSNAEVSKLIWYKLKSPKVSMKKAKFEYGIFYFNDYQILSEKIFSNDKDYLTRMPKLRPIKMPYTLKSDMARAAINLLEIKEGIILDPFCGIGGILLEAEDMKFQVIGNDISWNDLKYMKKNFEHYFPNSKYYRTLADCKNQFLKDNSVDGIVSDIPYGKASRKLGLDLYEKFLINASNMLKKDAKLVIIYANFVDFRDLANKYFEEVVKIDNYINKSMTRHIIVLKNSKRL